MFTYVIQYLFTHQTNKTSLLKFTFIKASWLTLLGLETLKNSTFKIPINAQTLSIKNQRTTSAKSFNLEIIKKLIKYSFTNVVWRQWLLPRFLRYSRLKVCRYYDRYSILQGNFNWKKTENVLVFLKLVECLTSLRDFEMFLTFWILRVQ